MKAYIIGGYIPNGGTFMAYHLGRILYEHFNIDCVVVIVNEESIDNSVFEYKYSFDTIQFDGLQEAITDRDLLIANPSFHDMLVGLRLPCRKLSYVQHFNTFAVLDGFFDHYVSVSDIVRDFLIMVYDIETPVIPPFIRTDLIPEPIEWDQKDDSVLVIGKYAFQDLFYRFADMFQSKYASKKIDIQLLNKRITHFDRFLDIFQSKYASKKIGFQLLNKRITHTEYLGKLNEHKYVLTLSPLEGFGLQPMEAMACGSAVLGFHGGGGRDFMRDGYNSEVVSYPHLDILARKLSMLLDNQEKARELAVQGRLDAMKYSEERFTESWKQYFRNKVFV